MADHIEVHLIGGEYFHFGNLCNFYSICNTYNDSYVVFYHVLDYRSDMSDEELNDAKKHVLATIPFNQIKYIDHIRKDF